MREGAGKRDASGVVSRATFPAGSQVLQPLIDGALHHTTQPQSTRRYSCFRTTVPEFSGVLHLLPGVWMFAFIPALFHPAMCCSENCFTLSKGRWSPSSAP